ncbi:MAG: 50S ribosomal protein L11 methyltransferase [Acidimicrobiales bacterium]
MVDLLIVAAAVSSDAEDAAAFLSRQGAASVSQRDWGRGRIIVSGGPFEPVAAAAVAASVRDAGWPADVRPTGGGHLAAWQSHTRPTIVDERLWVCFPWSEFDRSAAPLLVEIDPVRAFGTGAHPSTLLVLRALVARLHGGESVLDVGCGSGVLAIAAAVLGAGWVTAIDVAPNAVDATLENATRNRVTLVASTDPIDALDGAFDVVLANIGVTTLVSLSGALRARLAPNGWMVLSGISPAQVSKVAAAVGLDLLDTIALDDWVAVVLG